MARDFKINGETMISVKGRSDGLIPLLTQLGLAADQVNVQFEVEHEDIIVNAWGKFPAEVQVFGGAANISMNLIHVDEAVLEYCWQEAMGGTASFGQLARAGARLGNNTARFAPANTVNPATGLVTTGNHLIGLNISSPVLQLPYRFWYAYMSSPPITYPLGAEKSVIAVTWRAFAYTTDPWGGSIAQPGTVAGTGAQGAILFDRVLDS
jgi:hypothetical protein